MIDFYNSIDFESFYIVKPGDNLWKIASKFEVFNSGIQNFIKYLVILNPFLDRQKRNEPGDMIFPGDVIMLQTPDYSYQIFQYGQKPHLMEPFDGAKKERVKKAISANNLNSPSSRESFNESTFFYWLSELNNVAGSLDFQKMPFFTYYLKEAVDDYTKFINKSIELAERGLITESAFNAEHAIKLKKIAESTSRRFQELHQSFQKSMKQTKFHVGNLVKRTLDNKDIIRLSRNARRVIPYNLEKLSKSADKLFAWTKNLNSILFKVTITIDLSLRVREIIRSKKANRTREIIVQACGFSAAMTGGAVAGRICGRFRPRYAIPCGLAVGSYLLPRADKTVGKFCGDIYDRVNSFWGTK